MTIDGEGWFDWAERIPGPPAKLWPDYNTVSAVFFHSAVGSIQGVIDIVLGPVWNNRSVTGVIGYDGRFVQFYSVMKSPWANGSHYWNANALGFETEGGAVPPYDEPETPEQIDAQVRILQDLAEWKAMGVGIWQRPTTLKEHCEVYPTACPSGRIPWSTILAKLPPAQPLGVGAHYTDGSSEEIWVPRQGKVLDGLGVRYPDNTIQTVWTP